MIDPSAGRVIRTFEWLRYRRDRIASFDEFQAVGIGKVKCRHDWRYHARLLGVNEMSIPGGGRQSDAEATGAQVAAVMRLPFNDEPEWVRFPSFFG